MNAGQNFSLLGDDISLLPYVMRRSAELVLKDSEKDIIQSVTQATQKKILETISIVFLQA